MTKYKSFENKEAPISLLRWVVCGLTGIDLPWLGYIDLPWLGYL
jgi:hypothetical protein